jgi:ketosteroid isomerase-like protein
MALVGGVLAAWAGGGILSLGSLVGFFTVFGIAARNGILLINHCQHLEAEEGQAFGKTLVVRGARERLSPILMTTLATGLALVPLVVLGERPGHEIEHPLAVVILGGAGHLDPAQPVRAALALPPVRPPGRLPRKGHLMTRRSLPAAVGLGAGLLALTVAAPTAATAAERAAAGSGRGVFSHPLRGTSPYFPLRPGTEFTYRGTVRENGRTMPHVVTFTVTDLVKLVDGVQTVVAWDRDFIDGKLAEQELAFFATDDEGNVWNFGEYPEEYAAGKVTGAPSTWIRGVGGAYGGIHVLGNPGLTMQYLEGKVAAIDFWDVSRVVRLGGSSCEPLRCFKNVETVNEWSPNATDGIQVKFYAKGAGLVRVTFKGGNSQEVLAITGIRRLSAARMAVIDRAVTRMDTRAYTIAPVYRSTPRVHH